MRISPSGGAAPTRHLGRSLPIHWHDDPAPLAAAFLMLFGGFFAGFSLFALHTVATGGRISGSPTGIVIAAMVGLCVGLPIVLAGVNGLFLRTFIRIDASSVQFKRKAMIGAADWTEPMSAFQGVLATEQDRSGGSDGPSYTEYIIQLRHARDRSRDIELYRSRNGSGFRSETEGFAALFQLPVLTEQPDGSFAARDVGDLDKSVRRRAEEAHLEVPDFDPAALVGNRRLRVARKPQGYVFEASMRRALVPGSLVTALGLGGLYLYLGPGLPEGRGPDWVVPVVGFGFALVGLLFVHAALFRVERLEVSPDEVRVGRAAPGSGLDGGNARSMTADEIEEVVLRRDKYRQFQLTISGDSKTLTWGQFLPNSDRELVRDAVIRTLAR